MTTVRKLSAEESAARVEELAGILVDAVANGASVNFLTGFTHKQAVAFWRQQIGGIARDETQLLVAEKDGALIGTVMVMFAWQPNAPHRAEIGKMLVHSAHRRHGLGRQLLTAAEALARQAGRWLLILDTESGSAGDRLYRHCGWVPIGNVPNHALRPDGLLAETTVFYKQLPP
jgi:GNAT superfamily N-acetyltransferase